MTEATRSHGVTLLGPLHQALGRSTGWQGLGVAALLGAFSTLAFAPFHATPALIVSFVGLIWLIDGARGHRRWGKAIFARGWAFGFGFFLVSLYWTAAPFLVEPEKHAVFLWMPLVLLPAGMAMIWGLALALGAAFWSASPSRVFIFTLFFMLGESVRGHLFGGFPWNLAGTSWVPGGGVSQAASLGGIYWLSALTVFACSTPAAFVDTRKTGSRGVALRMMPALIGVVGLSALWAWGAQRVSQPVTLTSQTVVLMDAGIPQSEKYTDEGYANPELFRQYLRWLKDYPGNAGDIVLWPEGAIGSMLLDDRQLAPTVAYLGNRTLIAGTVRRQTSARDEVEWYNSIVILGPDSDVTGARGLYNKHRLVPVGELAIARILPYGEALSGILPGALQRMATSGFSPGVGPAVVGDDTVAPFVAMICYEALYSQVARRAQQEAGRPQWLVVLSNDAWFGAMIGPAQHYSQNRYRAIESGLPMARVASRGVSAIVDGLGRETGRASPAAVVPEGWRGRILTAQLPQALPSTVFFSRAGGLFFPVTLFLCTMLAFFFWRR